MITQFHVALFLACGSISALLWTATILLRPTSYDPFSEPFGDVPNAGGTDEP